jgi:hypothetical protein
MMPDELIKILKRYLRESNQSERLVAARIGVNHHTLHHWLTSDESPMKGSLALATRIGRSSDQKVVGNTTMNLHKFDDGWKIVASHSSTNDM